jgi:hypothetical protein
MCCCSIDNNGSMFQRRLCGNTHTHDLVLFTMSSFRVRLWRVYHADDGHMREIRRKKAFPRHPMECRWCRNGKYVTSYMLEEHVTKVDLHPFFRKQEKHVGSCIVPLPFDSGTTTSHIGQVFDPSQEAHDLHTFFQKKIIRQRKDVS